METVEKVDENNLLIGLIVSAVGIGIFWKFRKNMDNKLTKNFTLDEFQSKDGAEMPADVLVNIKKLAKNLQVIRDYFNLPIKINSAYRSPAHNAKVGGVKNSQHVKGQAADIVIQGKTPREIAEQLEKLIFEKKISQGGIGIYPTFVHYDIRGKKTRW